MEYTIQLHFEKLSIPLIEPSTCIIELAVLDKKQRYDYPLTSPITLSLPLTFTSTQNPKHTISLTIMIKLAKKYKKIAHGDINIYKKHFTSSDVPTIDKCINLSLYQTQLESMGHSTDTIKAELNKGKIYVKLTILDFMEVKKKLLPKDASLRSSNNKIKQGKANALHVDDDNESTTQNEFDDGLSELSISIVDVNEEGREGLELNEFINEDYLSKLKSLIENDYDSILPKDIDKLKQMNEMLYDKYSELKTKYTEMLTALTNENEEMRRKAKWYYDNYKQIKKEVFKGRKELRNKQNDLQKVIHANSEFNKKVLDNIVRYRNEVNELKEKMGVNGVDQANINDNDNEMKMMCELLGKAFMNGVNVCEGLDEDERTALKRLIDVQEEDDNENEIGSKIIALIENDVNELFSQKMITNVNIDQINTYQYSFTDDKGSKLITFKIENDKLYSDQGEGFDEWLIKNFAC
jgi:hypothetical protein